MRKKWLWLLVLPILLCGAIFWARDMAWKKMEAQFHIAAHDWLREAASTRVHDGRVPGSDFAVFFDASADSMLAIDQMKLIRSTSPRPQNKLLLFIDMDSGDSVGNTYGFYLSSRENRGWIEIPMPDVDSWKGYELAPETCRALKKRISAFKQEKERDFSVSQ